MDTRTLKQTDLDFFTSFRRLSVDWMAENGPSQRIGPTFPRFFPTANEFIAIGPISELFRLRSLDIKLANVAADNDVLKLREKWSIKKLGRINSGQAIKARATHGQCRPSVQRKAFP